MVHGGPWARDVYGYNSTHQWLANRGYAVLSVNYRGSTGFGKSFIAAGDRQWATTMHDDLIDAVGWAVDNKVTRKEDVATVNAEVNKLLATADMKAAIHAQPPRVNLRYWSPAVPRKDALPPSPAAQPRLPGPG